ncbi:fasciclin-1 isoform X3 [Ischnura elegans]|uniref:fasciclin-1 isoform X3 n=1 Tax=Ischnura elegans TaxID=197161 RepID=UPI001ED8A3A8|nr:fasciclin-1 isoform X3 [Ischnura elegans]
MDVLAVRLSSRPLSIFVVSLLIAAAAIPQGTSAAHKKTVDQKLREESTLSTFSNLIHNNLIANHTFEVRQATIFAPTNDAFDRYPKDIEGNVVLYHMTNLAQTLDQLKDSLSSELDGNPPLWVTRQKSPDGKEDIYINNAKIIRDRSNYLAKNTHSKNQVLHVLDEVLEPVTSSVPDSPIYNPDAFLFLDKFENLELEHRLRSFRQRVQQNNKADIFKAEGRHTFFIPVDEGFKPPPRPEKIDQKVIDGHVIPNRVLFTRATPCDEDYETLAFGDNLRVTISFTVQPDGKGSKLYVKSNTIVGDPNHATGVVLAEIVKANIPVKNGVVHLIHRPLMVVDTTVKQFLEGIGIEKEDGPLYRFYEMIVDHGSEFMTKITKLKSLTLFAPSNSAWNNSNLNNLIHNKEKMMEILNLHLVEQRLSLDDIKDNNMKQLFQVETAAKRKNLYFNILTSNENNITLTVEGGGVNATVIQPNIAATNGLVHIIDRVLGVPYTTVYQKLETDPMLNKTFHLGQQERFNEQLNDTRKRFTYFVPRDSAWEKAEIHSPSAHKKLFMKEFSYHVKQILERHLVVDHAYNMADLMKIANSTVVLPTVRDVLKIRVKEIEKNGADTNGTGYYLEWQGERIHVFRPDVECTNGVIHVIDSALLKESDVIVTGGSMPSSLLLSPLSFLAQLVPLFIVKFLL